MVITGSSTLMCPHLLCLPITKRTPYCFTLKVVIQKAGLGVLGQTYLPLIVSVPHVIRRRIRSLQGRNYSMEGVGIVPKYMAETYYLMLHCVTVE